MTTERPDAWKDEPGSWKIPSAPVLKVGDRVRVRLNGECEFRCPECKMSWHDPPPEASNIQEQAEISRILSVLRNGPVWKVCKPGCGYEGLGVAEAHIYGLKKYFQLNGRWKGGWFCAEELELL